jgi:hypothetical protein
MGIKFKVNVRFLSSRPQRNAQRSCLISPQRVNTEQACDHGVPMASCATRSCLGGLGLLLLLDLEKKRAVDMGKNTSEGDRGPDKGVELFVAANRELKMARGNALDLEILGGVLQWSAS